MRQDYAAQAMPSAPFTWEIQAELDGATGETSRIPCRWNRPIKIVGMYPTVTRSTFGALVVPTVDDVLVVLSANQRERFTNRLEQLTPTGMGEAYVSLGAISASQAAGNRLLEIELNQPSPQLDVGFRLKLAPVGGVAVYEDSIVSLAFYCVHI